MSRRKPTTMQVRRALETVADALAAAAPLSTRVRQQLGTAAEDAVALEGSIARAVRALRNVQPIPEDK